ncbi:hypothetical protein D3C71_2006580 [compost metagenome]
MRETILGTAPAATNEYFVESLLRGSLDMAGRHKPPAPHQNGLTTTSVTMTAQATTVIGA